MPSERKSHKRQASTVKAKPGKYQLSKEQIAAISQEMFDYSKNKLGLPPDDAKTVARLTAETLLKS